ncbi:predicted protein [Lichtheimia corymbifera JMRC:FSU:9682]|uniref:Uncharacterized protein n=1 Tax=Lichtheimia corymbifera JMRC:FSU:9682 TaxID=1263082 RepID=A0A068RJN4_9FUNG|nr:predicted protein [Lichtheimia corymbifera JMRC:FSU:9682]
MVEDTHASSDLQQRYSWCVPGYRQGIPLGIYKTQIVLVVVSQQSVKDAGVSAKGNYRPSALQRDRWKCQVLWDKEKTYHVLSLAIVLKKE